MHDPITLLRALIREELTSLALGDIAVVTSVFPHGEASDANNHECTVRLRSTELELRRVPIATPHVGMVSCPAIGDLVLISYVGGDPELPVVIGRLYSEARRPPLHGEREWRLQVPSPDGTCLAIDAEGSFQVKAGKTELTLKKDGAVQLKAEQDLTLEVKGHVTLSCQDCNVKASGSVLLGEGGSGVITEASHKCYFSGAPLRGSQSVKAKG